MTFQLANLSYYEGIWGMRRKATIAMIIGATLGCLVGAITEVRQPTGNEKKPYILSLNQRTGRPQLHEPGQPELK